MIDISKDSYKKRNMKENVVLFDEDFSEDAICSFEDKLYAAIESSYVAEIQCVQNGIGFSAKTQHFCDLPDDITKITHIQARQDAVYVAATGQRSGIMKFVDNHWDRIVEGSVYAFAVKTNGDIVYTDPDNHRLCLSVNGRSEVLAGTDEVGNVDGPTNRCSFGQPAGICLESECNIYITDVQMGTVKLIAGLAPTVRYLQCIGKLFGSFGIHKKGAKVQSAPLLQGCQGLNEVDEYITLITEAVRDNTGKTITNGPEGTISAIKNTLKC